ncbi:MAG: MtnX-like HAD-IB family phosphatase [Candidatus Zixiibacteriota bacterium]
MPSRVKKTIIFSDFDGSFSEKDIGHRIFRHFSEGRILPLVERWKRGEITSRECLSGEAAMIHPSLEEYYDFLADFRLARGAVEFYRRVKAAGIPFYIVSDGTDIYIDFMLKKYNLEEIRYFSNKGKVEDRTLTLDFIYDNNGCERCGCCKGARILEMVGSGRDEWEIVFIGDGLSDLCAIPHADIIYARGDLLEYCRTHDIKAIEFNDFIDILENMKKSGHISG